MIRNFFILPIFIIETLPLRIEDQKTKELRGKVMSLVKVSWKKKISENAILGNQEK